MNTTALNNITIASGNVDVNDFRVVNVANASADTDALNRQTGDSRYYLATTALDDLTAPNGNLTMNSYKITDLLDPTNAQDAATKTYTDT